MTDLFGSILTALAVREARAVEELGTLIEDYAERIEAHTDMCWRCLDSQPCETAERMTQRVNAAYRVRDGVAA